jgi:hypothetical protein
MWDTRSVELTVTLPADVADDVEEVRRSNPEFLGKAIQYAIARRAVFEELNSTLSPGVDSGAEPDAATHHD